ncbi:uncharacterized protein [Panulirus ornatus]|uniref:uncharacterized protein n=1 Tax=Panulirus ornatus TaxID=150431 RepID=UPI003A8C293F
MGSVLSFPSRSQQADINERRQTVSHTKNETLSRQGELVRRMTERQIAMQVAGVRETLLWFFPFAATSYVFLYQGYRKTNSWVVMFPLIPITFVCGYMLHFAYGNKTNLVKAMAENIMANETYMMAVPEWSTNATGGTVEERPTEVVPQLRPVEEASPFPASTLDLEKVVSPSTMPSLGSMKEDASPHTSPVSTGAAAIAASNLPDTSHYEPMVANLQQQ